MVSLLLAAGADSNGEVVRAGAWEVRCAKVKDAQCIEYDAVSSGPVTLRLKRDTSAISLWVEPQDCIAPKKSFAPINPTYSATTMTYMIRGHIVLALSSCKSKLPIPNLQAADTADLLRATEIVKTDAQKN
jgi:hypothetical protein